MWEKNFLSEKKSFTRVENIPPGRKILCLIFRCRENPGEWILLYRASLSSLQEEIKISLIFLVWKYLHGTFNTFVLVKNRDCVSISFFCRGCSCQWSWSQTLTKPNQKSFKAKPKFPEIENSECFLLQVKIWFQNHRYKHKRQAKEKAMTETPGGSGSSPRRWDLHAVWSKVA